MSTFGLGTWRGGASCASPEARALLGHAATWASSPQAANTAWRRRPPPRRAQAAARKLARGPIVSGDSNRLGQKLRSSGLRRDKVRDVTPEWNLAAEADPEPSFYLFHHGNCAV